MSWRDRIPTTQGSFRGAEFFVESDDGAFGRRTQTHDYPKRDKPYVEDMGRASREITFDAVIIGPDYDRARDALIAALEQPGPGMLVHPYYGTLRVTLTAPARKHETTREGGKCTFTITCVEGGDLVFPSAVTDTAAGVQAKANTALEKARKAFSKRFDFTGLPGWQLVELVNSVGKELDSVNSYVGDIAGGIAAVIRAPYNLAAVITDGLQTLRNTITEPLRALNLYKGLFSAGNGAAPIPQTTSNRQAQAANTDAMFALIQQTATIEAIQSSSQASYTSSDDAMAVRDELLTAIDNQMERTDISGQSIDDELYQSLADLRAAMADDLRIRGARLPEIEHVEFTATLPALVLAHLVFGDAERDAEIIERNRISHPLFVRGGQSLEVLSE